MKYVQVGERSCSVISIPAPTGGNWSTNVFVDLYDPLAQDFPSARDIVTCLDRSRALAGQDDFVASQAHGVGFEAIAKKLGLSGTDALIASARLEVLIAENSDDEWYAIAQRYKKGGGPRDSLLMYSGPKSDPKILERAFREAIGWHRADG